jgi:single-strand DNA-binding protein
MASVNKVILLGNLTRDPEVKSLPNGTKVANFSIATNHVYKDKDGVKQEKVTFHNITAYGKTAETIGKFFSKGKPIYLEGRLDTRSWEKDGVKFYRTEILMDTFQFVSDGSKKSEQKEPTVEEQYENYGGIPDAIEYPSDDISPEDIPF